MNLAKLICGAAAALLMAQTSVFAQGLPTGGKVADAKPGDVRVYATLAIGNPLEATLAAAEKAIGKRIVYQYGSARGNLNDAIMAGSGDFEVAILLPDVDEKLLAAGKIKSEAYELARVPIAFAIRGNTTVDMSTPDKVKAALLGATSVKYAPTGAALLTVNKVFDDLKVRDLVKDNSKTRGEVPLTGNQYEVNIYPLSEILVRTDVKNLGPVIKELQVPSIIEATIGAKTRDEAGARALIKFLQSAAIDPELKKNGMGKGQGKQIASK